MNKYTTPDAKAFVTLLAAVATVLQTIYPTAQWSIVATSVIAALLVWFMPNSSSSGKSSNDPSSQS